MSTVAEAAQEIEDAAQTVDGIRVYRLANGTVDPPAVILGPPSLTWEGMCDGPTGARFPLYVVTAMDERALERLWDLAPRVAKAVDGVAEGVVVRADPGVFQAGGTDLPSYTVEVEVAL